jgi:ATP-dependent exoDNAse (exonuclease V) beta subunit
LSQAQVAGLSQSAGRGRRLWQAVLDPAPSALDRRARGRVTGLVGLWREAQARRWTLTPAAFMGWVLQRSGLAATRDPAAQRALRKLLAVAHGYEADHPAHGLPEMAEYLRRLLESDPRAKAPELNSQAEAVQVMTVHASKGLEFPVVIAADCRQKVSDKRSFDPFHDPLAGLVIPDKEAEAEPNFVERMRRARNEGRCLWYVTLSRAKRRLIITATNDGERIQGRYAVVKTFFEELWNSLAETAVEGVELVEEGRQGNSGNLGNGGKYP